MLCQITGLQNRIAPFIFACESQSAAELNAKTCHVSQTPHTIGHAIIIALLSYKIWLLELLDVLNTLHTRNMCVKSKNAQQHVLLRKFWCLCVVVF